ncbi:mechanosensitive ion channel [Pseudooceanicola sp. CBS1P-1]|uniref:Mechanosensitive ion channel n=1 Tax=Pseudooceanicola albus TaxID=2692189 RepID=A0A6L7G3J1_9RHOB|nr:MULTISPECIES: mechanosensitive ion channel domain-containing protein [Pseudooceanicola]MBT9384550.1 mechanosensitive ion channel [Pseudooceanicola endophyticus]MXN18252.1 mechanosensitive ion channel [Pseudooceanicola albus]
MRRARDRIAAALMLGCLALGLTAPGPSLAQDQTPTTPQTETASQTGAEAPAADQGSGDSLKLLLQVLQDDKSRAALVKELEAAQSGSGTDTASQSGNDSAEVSNKIVESITPADSAVPSEGLSFGRRIALITQEVAEGAASQVEDAWTQITRAPMVFDGLNGSEAGVLLEALKELALIIVVTVAVFLALRRMGKSLYVRMGTRARDSGIVRTVALFVASVLIDMLIVVVSWAVGYLIATLLLGNFGEIGIRQTLYLNAFLLVEMSKVLVRMVLSPSARHLRPLPVSDSGARYLTTRLNFMVGLVGYGQLLIVPIINANASYAAGRAVSALIALIVVALAMWMVMRNREPVAQWIERGGQPEAEHAEELRFAARAEQPSGTEGGLDETPEEFPMGEQAPPEEHRSSVRFLVRNWHWPALIYLLVMLVVVLVQPGDAAFRSMMNSGQVLVVALLGVTVSGVLTRVMVRGIQLPENVTARLPLLERRLNTFVPKALFVLRLAIFVMVVVFALNAISVIDLKAWLASQIGLQLTSRLFSVAAVLLVSFVIWVGLTSWVDYRLNPEFGKVPTARERTLLTLLRNAATIALIIITLMFVLSEVGLDIAPLLASAGVLGLAIGFGAQKMVQDIITGIFIQFENAMNVGDVVTVGGTTGVVERLTIRSVSLRDYTGAFHVIPFSSVDMVTNFVREFGYSVCDMGVAYRENIDEVKQAMVDAFEELRKDPTQSANIIGDLEWFGINAFGDSAIVVRTRIKCVPGTQWGVGRAYNGVLKTIFDARNIEIPFPHQTLYLGEAKDGSTQPFRIRMEGQDGPAEA